MKMVDCPRFDRCNAALCPLDTGWRNRLHARGDSVCLYALESMKPTAAEAMPGPQGEEIRAACAVFIAELEEMHESCQMGMPRGSGMVRASLRSATETGSRVLASRALSDRRTSDARQNDVDTQEEVCD
jgi:hypothetical protein